MNMLLLHSIFQNSCQRSSYIRGIWGENMKEYIIKDTHGNQATILPEKGATVISFIANGVEVFYKDEENIESPERPRCGIPFLFPVFGRTPEDSIYPMEIHGFGHTSVWSVLEHEEDVLRLELEANDETKKVYPFEFRVELIFSVKDAKLNIHQIYENLGEIDMPYSFGFHPYFVTNPTEVKVEVNAELEMDMLTGKPVPVKNPMVQLQFPEGAPESGAFFLQAKEKAILHRPDGNKVHMEFDENFNRLVLWAVRGKEFLCVEPINSSPNGLVTGDCYTLKKNEKREAVVSFGVER